MLTPLLARPFTTTCRAAACLVTLVAGCASSVEFDGPVDGLYALEFTSLADDCDPGAGPPDSPVFEGGVMLTAALTTDGEWILYSRDARVEVPAFVGASAARVSEWNHPDTPGCHFRVRRQTTVVELDEDRAVLEFEDRWEVLESTGCAGVSGLAPYRSPQASCVASYRYTFALLEACHWDCARGDPETRAFWCECP